MTREEALKLLRGGRDGIHEWNLRRNKREDIPDLNGADLSEADLNNANLSGVNLKSADLNSASLHSANLRDANLNSADLRYIMPREAKLSRANLGSALIKLADFWKADLSDADLSYADISWTVIRDSNLSNTKLDGRFEYVVFADLDLSEAKGLNSAYFNGPCDVSVSTLEKSRGRIPDSFLEGCGFQKWQVLDAKLYDPALTGAEISDLQYKIFEARTQGPLFLGRTFISYSHADTKFVDKLYDRLRSEGTPVWLDRHDLVAGPIKTQVVDAIRINDVVVLVLSSDSVESDWVNYELSKAREEEKKSGRKMLCPVALDKAWTKKDGPVWQYLRNEYVILDFAGWDDPKIFDGQFKKLLKGLKIYYPKRTEAASGGGAT